MNRIQRWLGRRAERERRGTMESFMLSDAFGASSASGVAVSEEGSLRNTAVLACVRLLANSTAMP